LLEAFDVVRRRAEQLGEGDRSWVLNRLAGGRTVLLNELLGQVSDVGWLPTPGAEPGVAARPADRNWTASRADAQAAAVGVQSLQPQGRPQRRRRSGRRRRPHRGIADSGRFADDLAALFEELGQTARELGVGVLILVDELPKASAQELTALNTAVHHLGQADLPSPLTFVGAGLPSLPAQLAEARISCRRSASTYGTAHAAARSTSGM